MHSISYTMFDKKRGKEQFPFQTETSVNEPRDRKIPKLQSNAKK